MTTDRRSPTTPASLSGVGRPPNVRRTSASKHPTVGGRPRARRDEAFAADARSLDWARALLSCWADHLRFNRLRDNVAGEREGG